MLENLALVAAVGCVVAGVVLLGGLAVGLIAGGVGIAGLAILLGDDDGVQRVRTPRRRFGKRARA